MATQLHNITISVFFVFFFFCIIFAVSNETLCSEEKFSTGHSIEWKKKTKYSSNSRVHCVYTKILRQDNRMPYVECMLLCVYNVQCAPLLYIKYKHLYTISFSQGCFVSIFQKSPFRS